MIAIPRFAYETTISYADVGSDQLLSYKGALRLLQEAAALASDACGYGIKDIPTKGVHWILMGWRVELLHKPVWSTPVRIETWPRSMEGFADDRDFLMYAGDTLVLRASSRWFLINAQNGRIARVTDEIRSAYPMEDAKVFAEPIATNGSPLENAADNFSILIGRRDIDTNHHVNNLCYLDYALEALPQEVYDNLPGTLEIVYRKQIMLGTEIHCLYGKRDDGKHQVEIRSTDAAGKDIHHAYIWFY